MAILSLNRLPAESSSSFLDESRFERIDGNLIPRPRPGNVHARFQDRVKSLLQASGVIGVEVLAEWSITRPEQAGDQDPDYMTPDVLMARVPYEQTPTGHLIRPAFLAVEISSPNQRGLFWKAEIYGAWGVEHVWIIDPQSRECFEFHGGNQFTLVKGSLSAGDLTVALAEIFADLSNPNVRGA